MTDTFVIHSALFDRAKLAGQKGVKTVMTATFEPGTLVRVTTQPPDMYVKIFGEVGIIECVLDCGYAQIIALHPDGRSKGGGCVPVSCLSLESNPTWIAAKTTYETELNKYNILSRERQERIKAKISELARRFNVTYDEIMLIHNEVSSIIEYS